MADIALVSRLRVLSSVVARALTSFFHRNLPRGWWAHAPIAICPYRTRRRPNCQPSVSFTYDSNERMNGRTTGARRRWARREARRRRAGRRWCGGARARRGERARASLSSSRNSIALRASIATTTKAARRAGETSRGARDWIFWRQTPIEGRCRR